MIQDHCVQYIYSIIRVNLIKMSSFNLIGIQEYKQAKIICWQPFWRFAVQYLRHLLSMSSFLPLSPCFVVKPLSVCYNKFEVRGCYVWAGWGLGSDCPTSSSATVTVTQFAITQQHYTPLSCGNLGVWGCSCWPDNIVTTYKQEAADTVGDSRIWTVVTSNTVQFLLAITVVSAEAE